MTNNNLQDIGYKDWIHESASKLRPFYNTCFAYLPELNDGLQMMVEGVSVGTYSSATLVR